MLRLRHRSALVTELLPKSAWFHTLDSGNANGHNPSIHLRKSPPVSDLSEPGAAWWFYIIPNITDLLSDCQEKTKGAGFMLYIIELTMLGIMKMQN